MRKIRRILEDVKSGKMTIEDAEKAIDSYAAFKQYEPVMGTVSLELIPTIPMEMSNMGRFIEALKPTPDMYMVPKEMFGKDNFGNIDHPERLT